MSEAMTRPPAVDAVEKLAIIDADFHPMPVPTDPQVAVHMSQRWKDYIARFGMGYTSTSPFAPAMREYTHRLDATDANGRVGVDPIWCRDQVLDPFDMSAAILTCPQSYILNSGGNMPVESRWSSRAPSTTPWCIPGWRPTRATTPRLCWRAICRTRRGDPALQGRPGGDRFVSVLISPAGQEPLGRQRYWEIFETCVHYDLPLTFHVPGMGRQQTAVGNTNYYGEMHMNFANMPMTLVPSLIFEGVFDRFPTLRIAMIELGWSWAVPFSWRLDNAWRKLRSEVPHLRASRPTTSANISGSPPNRSRKRSGPRTLRMSTACSRNRASRNG